MIRFSILPTEAYILDLYGVDLRANHCSDLNRLILFSPNEFLLDPPIHNLA